MARICCISDMHGQLDFNIEPCNILCICGDIVPLNIQNRTDDTFKWINTVFLEWCKQQKTDKVLLIGGNHDFAIYRHPDRVKKLFEGTKVTYLLDEEYVHTDNDGSTIKFYGSPWCHKFYNWAFMDYSDEELKNIFLRMPNDVNVLLTHDCPYGACDVLLQDVYWATGEHIGNKGLAEAILEKQPKMNLTGHLHSTNKVGEMLGETFVCNTSVLNENYNLVYEPHYFDVFGDGSFKNVKN